MLQKYIYVFKHKHLILRWVHTQLWMQSAEDAAWRCEVSVCAKPSGRMHSDLVSPILLSKEA